MFLRDPLRSGCHAARNILNNFKLSKFWSACYAVVPGVFRPNVQHTLHNFGSSTKDSSKPWKHKEMQLQLTNIVEAKLYWGLSLLGGERAWSSTFYLKSIAMDSVQVRKVEPPLVTRHAYQHTKRSCWLIRSRWPVPSERVWDFDKNFCKTRLAVFLPQPIWPLLLGIEWGKLQTAPKSL